MKKLILCLTLLGFLPAHIRAGVMLGTTPDPLLVNSNASSTTTSGPMDVTITSNASDTMAAWNVQLQITPLAGATGTLMFQTATQGPSPYIFGSNGFGVIATITNSGSQLAASDFDGADGLNFSVTVPATPTNLLATTYLASAGASGKFGIFAVPGGPLNSVTNPALTYWNDGNNNQSFSGVTPGTNLQIGEVDITLASVPEPSTLTLLGIAIAGITAWRWRCKTLPLPS
jgi:hypothetical protein